MKSDITFSFITIVLVLLQSCAHSTNCPEPTAVKISSETSTKIDARLIKAANMDASFEKKAEQIRQSLSPELQSFEIIEYRACTAYQNGLIDKERYNELINIVLPLILKPGQVADSSVVQTGKVKTGTKAVQNTMGTAGPMYGFTEDGVFFIHKDCVKAAQGKKPQLIASRSGWRALPMEEVGNYYLARVSITAPIRRKELYCFDIGGDNFIPHQLYRYEVDICWDDGDVKWKNENNKEEGCNYNTDPLPRTPF